MSGNTVNTGLTVNRRKRVKRVVENDEYTAFTRRILAGLARRVAAGDVEALSALNSLTDEVTSCTRTAVRGLRDFGYSWSEIAARLGVSRQAAQQRWGDPAERGALDRRLVEAGYTIDVPTLVAVFADHHPGEPRADECPGCGYSYERRRDVCPTLAVVWPLLYGRRREDEAAIGRLSPVQYADLCNPNAGKTATAAARRSAQPSTKVAADPDAGMASLLDLVDGAGAP